MQKNITKFVSHMKVILKFISHWHEICRSITWKNFLNLPDGLQRCFLHALIYFKKYGQTITEKIIWNLSINCKKIPQVSSTMHRKYHILMIKGDSKQTSLKCFLNDKNAFFKIPTWQSFCFLVSTNIKEHVLTDS